jgi:inner membrane protein
MMAIPAVFVWALIYQRSSDASAAIQEVAQLRGGMQDLMGPAIMVPFERDIIANINGANQVQTVQGRMVLYAETGTAASELKTEIRRRGLHDVPVYTAETDFAATFEPSRIAAEAPTGARLRWNEARIYMALGDLRGAKEVRLTLGGRALELSPVENAAGYAQPGVYPPSGRSMVSAPLNWIFPPATGPLQADAYLRTAGAQRVSIAAFAKDTVITMKGDWPSPSFDGGFLPDERNVRKDSFDATWRIPFLARGAPSVGADLSFDTLINTSPGATLVDPGNPYQSVERALKYAPMFIGLVFLTYFLFEATSRVRAHPAQYVLVGLAQTVFYMLLLSISEVAGFNLGFIIAATATVLTLSSYAGSVFGSRMAMLKALAVFTTLYALIYVLMRQEDYGLLVGSIAAFLAIAGTMWMTRNLDWYGVGRSSAPQPARQV